MGQWGNEAMGQYGHLSRWPRQGAIVGRVGLGPATRAAQNPSRATSTRGQEPVLPHCPIAPLPH